MHELISDNFFALIVGSLDLTRVSVTSELLLQVYKLTQVISPEQNRTLERMGLFVNLSMILMKEVKEHIGITNAGPTAITAHFIVDKLPALPRSDCYEDVDSICTGILFTGPELAKQNQEHREITYIIELTLNHIFNICQIRTCHYVYHALLLKLIFWGNYFQVLTTLVDVRELIAFFKTLITSSKQGLVVLGLASVHTLLINYVTEFQGNQLHETIKTSKEFLTSKEMD